MVSFADVRRWKPDALEEVFRTLGKRRDELVGLDDELHAARNPAGWTGEAAENSAKRHAELGKDLHRLGAEVDGVRDAVGKAAEEVEQIKKRLDATEHQARANGFEITEDGGIRDAAPPQDVPAEDVERVKQQRLRARDELAAAVESILDDAERTDADLAKTLTAAEQDEIQPGAAPAQTMAAMAPKDGGPAENAKWWKSLSDAEREAYTKNPPAWLGNRDGIPAEVRDKANRARIADERSTLQARKDELRAGGVSGGEEDELAKVDAKLKSIDAVEQMLARGDRQLLLLDTGGERAKAAVAVGNVDTADHVSVYTPGMNTTVDGSLNADKQMDQLRRQAQFESDRHGDGGKVAAVTWVGTEFPQRSEVTDPDRSVATAKLAEDGGKKLASFCEGINASRDDDPHLTAIGHSYGSTITGYAMQEQGHGVDDAVFSGSPGVGTDDVEDLNVPAGHSYRIEAKNDWVADLGRFGGDPSHLDGMTGLSAKESEHGKGVEGHSSYFAPDSTSQYNMSTVVAGVPDRAVKDDGRGIGDVISGMIS
ncbi:Alpha/beta hydrolase [Saccharopolyspora shandongensis]|uniref:Alpha/beta hydrolase n=1 Tax=Saccharopolyspora shandongensis TaxID=418495 RepID=A0A1H3PNT6_9PSEU|nr:alpha/beta hydrolase [Saccharopolyspora shandongensis]SDZ02698.1 Alpha/beta hydrolase [Saccharopolyspora shandongensis]